ncbi:MAG: FeoA family protein [Candidatus Asgardarchaeia archaeon]
MIKKLSEMKVGEKGRIVKIHGDKALKKKLLDMGLTPRAEIRVLRTAPLKDPIDFEIKGYQLSLRKIEADNVLVEVGEP